MTTTDYNSIISRYYPAGTLLRDIYMRHCRSVAALALEINRRLPEPVDEAMLEGAAMTHDIGIVMCDAPSIECRGRFPYIAHGIAGAVILRREGAPEEWAHVAERHTGAGLTAAEIEAQGLPLPRRDLLPETLLERIVCYADKFYSKSGDTTRKSLEQVRASMARHGSDTLDRFDRLHAELGGASL